MSKIFMIQGKILLIYSMIVQKLDLKPFVRLKEQELID